MDIKNKKLWNLAIGYLKKGSNKDFVLHTKGVVKAMNLILKKEKGNPDISKKYQRSTDKKKKLIGMKLHIKYAPRIIRLILKSLHYKTSEINEIINIVIAHKFCKPRRLDKQLLIDADHLSDAFKIQFYSDAKAYKTTPEKLYNFRIKDNHFYTKTAKNIFENEINKRSKEFNKKIKYTQGNDD